MSSGFLVHLDVTDKPYLKDFFLTKFKVHPFPAHKINLIGILIEPFLEKGPDYLSAYHFQHSFDIELTFVNKGYKDPRVYNYITPANQVLIIRSLDVIFWEFFFMFMDLRIDIKKRLENEGQGSYNLMRWLAIDIKKSIDEFSLQYNIPHEHLSYDTLRKRYYRERVKRQDFL